MINELQVENQKLRSINQKLELEILRLQADARKLREDLRAKEERLEQVTRALARKVTTRDGVREPSEKWGVNERKS